MPRAVSIHIGVDRPHGGHVPLKSSENNAWHMAQLANQAGYESLFVLRGTAATRQAVRDVLTRAADVLTHGATLFLSFSGHGCEQPDTHHDQDERSRKDQGWCLADGHLLDDELAGLWRRFADGVRILVVSESCYSGGVIRDDETQSAHPPAPRVQAPVVYRGQPAASGGAGSDPAAAYAGSCIAAPPQTHGIRASLLLLSASHAEQKAQEGLFAKHLLRVWNEGAFRGSYCELHHEVSQGVKGERGSQHPQIVALGASDPAFPLATAFHRGPPPGPRPPVFRGHPAPDEPVLHW